jgi:putative transposase
MAQHYVAAGRLSVKVACLAFGISQTCYRYEAKLNAENDVIADWLVRLTTNQRNWGFGLCFLYLRNVKAFSWNHKRVYRIYRELELNLRIKPRHRWYGKAAAAGGADADQPDLVDGLHA